MRYKGFDTASVQRNLVISLIVSAAISNSLIIFSGEDRAVFSNWTINAAAAVSLGISLLITWRQKLDGLYGKTYAAYGCGTCFTLQ